MYMYLFVMYMLYENYNFIYINVYVCRKWKEEFIKKMSKGFVLCVVYVVNIGGVVMFIGILLNFIL